MNYSQKLNDPRWQKKRLEIMQRDQWKCTMCKDDRHELHIHHINYEMGRDPWDCQHENVTTLCAQCHKEVGISVKLMREALVKFPDGISSIRMSIAILHVLSSFQKFPFFEGENPVGEVLLAAAKMEDRREAWFESTGEKMTREVYIDECETMVGNRSYR